MKIGSPQWAALIIEGAGAFGLSLEPEQVSRFATHASELIKWNKKFNLTRITNPGEVALKHYLDSLAPLPWIPQFSSLLDVGSGGGFPGIPLKIANPSIRLTLIDASRKRISFLKHCLRILDFENCEALQVRGEALAADIESSSSAGYDVIISRALGSLEVFAQIALPLLADKGTIIALKGKADAEEFEALTAMVSKIKPESKSQRPYRLAHHTYVLPFDQSERSIIIIKKSD